MAVPSGLWPRREKRGGKRGKKEQIINSSILAPGFSFTTVHPGTGKPEKKRGEEKKDSLTIISHTILFGHHWRALHADAQTERERGRRGKKKIQAGSMLEHTITRCSNRS